MKVTRLTPDAFERTAAGTRQGAEARAMARAVLVDGRTQVDVAAEYGLTKQRVSSAVATIERAYMKAGTPGMSTVRVELELPETLALELWALVDAVKLCGDESKIAAALEKAASAVRQSTKLLLKGASS